MLFCSVWFSVVQCFAFNIVQCWTILNHVELFWTTLFYKPTNVYGLERTNAHSPNSVQSYYKKCTYASKTSNIFKKDRFYLSAYDIQHLTQARLNVRCWILGAKGVNRIFENIASELEYGPHFANVISRWASERSERGRCPRSSDFFAYTQEKWAKVHFQLRFSYNFLAESPIGWISGG